MRLLLGKNLCHPLHPSTLRTDCWQLRVYWVGGQERIDDSQVCVVIGAGSDQAEKKNALQVNSDTEHRSIPTGISFRKGQQQTSFFLTAISYGMGLLQAMYHSVWEARKLRPQQPWIMVFLWYLEGSSADSMCTWGRGTPSSPSVSST